MSPKYKIVEKCLIKNRKGEEVEDWKAYHRVTDNSVVIYCNECEDGGCLLEGEEIL
jgi:hypothetical protein